MRHQPFFISRITAKAKTYVVIYSAAVHGVKSFFDHDKGILLFGLVPVSQKKIQVVGHRNLGAFPNPP